MKKTLFSLTLITTLMTQVQAQTTDLQQIEETLNYYLVGMTDHNSALLKKAFEPSASMKWVAEKYEEVNAVTALSDYLDNNAATKVRTSITSINIIGDAANAQLLLEYETFSFVDFMHLLKIDGQWKIVSKTYTTVKKDF